MTGAALALACSLAAGIAGCAPPPAPLAPPSLASWRAARARLDAVRRDAVPRTLRLALTLREPRSGRVLEARGAAAIAPPSSLRMILLGPGGTTALDLWIDGDRFRFAVPAIDLLRRGDASTPRASMRGMPVDFLRWWMLRPAEGTLLWAAREGAVEHLWLRDGRAIVELAVPAEEGAPGPIVGRRATWSNEDPPQLVEEETVEADQLGCGRVRYRQARAGLEVEVRCEGEDRAPPSPRAFQDPDAPGERSAP